MGDKGWNDYFEEGGATMIKGEGLGILEEIAELIEKLKREDRREQDKDD